MLRPNQSARSKQRRRKLIAIDVIDSQGKWVREKLDEKSKLISKTNRAKRTNYRAQEQHNNINTSIQSNQNVSEGFVSYDEISVNNDDQSSSLLLQDGQLTPHPNNAVPSINIGNQTLNSPQTDFVPTEFEQDLLALLDFAQDPFGPTQFDQDPFGPTQFDQDPFGPTQFDQDQFPPKQFDQDQFPPPGFGQGLFGPHDG